MGANIGIGHLLGKTSAELEGLVDNWMRAAAELPSHVHGGLPNPTILLISRSIGIIQHELARRKSDVKRLRAAAFYRGDWDTFLDGVEDPTEE